MLGKILRRCSICKQFHAAYLVNDPELGKCFLCYPCWKARSFPKKEGQPDRQKAEIQVKHGVPEGEI